MGKKPKIKILVGYHKPAYLLKNDIFEPIHLGRALTMSASKDGVLKEQDYRWMLDNMIGDDTGDNISKENRKFCELTAFYWAWKNYSELGNPDYIGFMHYRRHLSFNRNKHFTANKYGFVEETVVDDGYLQKYRLNDDAIVETVQGRDLIVAARTDLLRLGTLTPYNHYENSQKKLHIKDYEAVLAILNKKYPEYTEAAVRYNNADYAYFTNVFIMKKDIFCNYCRWLFDILEEAERQIDLSNYNVEETRALAYIAEWLFGIYITRLREQGADVLELQEILVTDTSVLPEILPAFADNSISVCFSTDANYILYTGVAIQSLIANADDKYNYDIIVLAGDISAEDENKVVRLADKYKNINIRFVDVNAYIDKALSKNFFLTSHFSPAVYYRIFIARILTAFDRVLYLDSDLVLKADAALLWQTDIKDKALGAVPDTEVIRMYFSDPFITDYVNRTLGLKNPYGYFNSGVLIMSLDKIRSVGIEKKFAEVMNRVKSPYMVDQDILNVIFQDDVYFLPGYWNYEYHLPIWNPGYRNELPLKILEDYLFSKENAKIVHFAGSKKPWNYPRYEMSDCFWNYARQTPFYEEILFSNFIPSVPEVKESVSYANDYLPRKLHYAKIKLLSKITLGKKRKFYRLKRKELKKELKCIKREYRAQVRQKAV